MPNNVLRPKMSESLGIGAFTRTLQFCSVVLLLVLLLSVLSSQPARGNGIAAGQWFNRTTNTSAGADTKQALNALGLQGFHLVIKDEGWLLIEQQLYWTRDNGRSWSNITPNLADSIINVMSFIDAQHGWVLATGLDGSGFTSPILARTNDGGRTWQYKTLALFKPGEVESLASKAFLQFINPQTGWLVVKRATSSNFNIGSLFRTNDGGNTWTRLSIPIGEPVYFVTETSGWAVGGAAGDQVYRSEDGGQTWAAQLIDSAPSLAHQRRYYQLPQFDNLHDGVLPVVFSKDTGSEIRFYVTHDSGRSWRSASTLALTEDIPAGTQIPMTVLATDHIMVVPPHSNRLIKISGSSQTQVVGDDPILLDIVNLDMTTASEGWAERQSVNCAIVPQQDAYPTNVGRTVTRCVSAIGLVRTSDGGRTWQAMHLPVSNVSVIRQETDSVSELSTDVNPTIDPLNHRSSVQTFSGQGFDTCEIPSLGRLQDWWTNGPYRAVNLYIGGSNRACSNAGLTSSYISQMSQQGWKFFPTWVGPQAACSSYTSRMSSDTTTAQSQGVSEANSAADTLSNLGLGGTVVYYDLEGYTGTQSCRDASKSFISGWTAQLRSRGFQAGVYGSSCSSYIYDFSGISNIPDAIWPANWIYGSYNSSASVWGTTCISDSNWSNHQRIRQYTGGHNETYGSTTLNIDSDVLDGPVASYSGGSSCPTVTGLVQLWNQPSCTGNNTIANGTGLWSLVSSFNDQAQSIAIPNGWSVTLYKADSTSSPSICVLSTTSDLDSYQYADGSSASQSATWIYVHNQSNCPSIGNPPSTPSSPYPSDSSILGRTSDTTLYWSTDGISCDVHIWGGNIDINPSGGNCSSLYLGNQFGGSYLWQVTAHNTYGSKTGPTWYFYIQPHEPTNLYVSTISQTQIDLSWTKSSDDPANVDAYSIYLNGSLFTSVNTGTTSSSINWLVCGSSCRFSVTAVRQGVESAHSNYVTVYQPVSANFTATPISGTSPLTVTFTNQSTGSYSSLLWNFGDGTSSTTSDPSHMYSMAGVYTVTLTANGLGGSSVLTKSNYVIVTAANQVVAAFTASPLSGTLPLTVTFTNQSTGYYTDLLWNFGDGTSSTAFNPSHMYTKAGVYTVSLTASGVSGSGVVTKSNYIAVESPSDTIMWVSPPVQSANVGTPITISVNVSNVDDLGAFEFTLSFDPSLIGVQSVSIGEFLGSTGRTIIPIGGVISNAVGTVALGAASLGTSPGPDGAGRLATVRIMPKATGSMALHFSSAQLSSVSGTAMPFSMQDGIIHISQCRGDVDGDGDVDIIDVQLIAYRWGKKLPDPLYETWFDIDGDGDIDIIDIQMVAYRWGTACNVGAGTIKSGPLDVSIATFGIRQPEGLLVPNKVFTAIVVISNVVNLGSFEFTLGYSSTVVEVLGVTLGAFPGSTGRTIFPLTPVISPTDGTLTFGAATLGATPLGPYGDGIMAEVQMRALTISQSSLVFLNGQVSDIAGTPQIVVLGNAESINKSQRLVFLPMVIR